jgi:hypothetical protein
MVGNTIIIILLCGVLGQLFLLRSTLTRRLDEMARRLERLDGRTAD